MKKKEMQNLVMNIYSNMNNIFREEAEPILKVDIETVTEEFFTAELMAFKIQLENLTQTEYDLIDFTHILNKLAVQYILENNEE